MEFRPGCWQLKNETQFCMAIKVTMAKSKISRLAILFYARCSVLLTVYCILYTTKNKSQLSSLYWLLHLAVLMYRLERYQKYCNHHCWCDAMWHSWLSWYLLPPRPPYLIGVCNHFSFPICRSFISCRLAGGGEVILTHDQAWSCLSQFSSQIFTSHPDEPF